jgi:hypothetical protein
MRARYEGGSLAGFIIIGVVLTLVLVGGLYGLNRYNAEQTEEVATEASDEPANNNSGEESASGDEQQSAQNEEPAAPAEQQPGNETSDGSNPQPSTPSDPQGDTTDEEELPQTGPADTIGALIAIFMVSFALSHYLRSRAHNSH